MKRYVKSSDNGYKYHLIGYSDRNEVDFCYFYGFDTVAILDYAASMLSDESLDYIKLENLDNGEEFFNTANAWYTYVEEGDLPEDAYSIID